MFFVFPDGVLVTDSISKIRSDGAFTIKEARRIHKKLSKRDFNEALLEELRAAIIRYENALRQDHPPAARKSLQELDHFLTKEFGRYKKSIFRDWFDSLFSAVMIALVLRLFIIEPFMIPSGSMIPTILIGDHIFVSKLSYGIRLPLVGKYLVQWDTPHYGDVIVFVYPVEPDKDFIKRVVGLPGDTITVEGTEVYINGKVVESSPPKDVNVTDFDENQPSRDSLLFTNKLAEHEFHVLYDRRLRHPRSQYTVPEGHLFVMGDNRDSSSDSRVWGFVPMDNVKGHALVVWWSASQGSGFRFSRIGTLLD